MSKFIGMVCAAALMLATSQNVFGDVTDANTAANTTTTTTTMKSKRTTDKPVFFKSGMPLDDQDNMPDGKMKYHAGYTAPAAVEVDGSWDVVVSGAYTYYYAGQENMDIATINTPAVGPALVGPAVGFVNQSFGYTSGFKVGLGFDTHCDDWSVAADYTWYDHTREDSYAADAGFVFGTTDLFVNEQAADNTALTSSWQLKMNMVDLTSSRPFYQSKRVVVAPAAGIRALWIHQNQNVAFAGGTTATYGGESRSWALGPKACVNTHWMLPGGFRIETGFGSSLLYTRYTTISRSETVDGVTSASEQTDLNKIRPTMDAGMGIGFGAYTFNNKFFFDVSARYDFMQFWSQNMLRNYSTNLEGFSAPTGDLYMHGLTLNLRCDF